MFTTFQTTTVGLRSPGGGEAGDHSRPGRSAGSRRISTSNACVECRRRKIRCDGTQPCGQCQWYQHPEACNYSKPAQRVVPSRKLVEKLQSSIEQHQMVLSRLFGSRDLEPLISLPREELLNLALSKPVSTSPTTSTPTRNHGRQTSHSEGADSLETLEQAPDHDLNWGDLNPPDRIHCISDDINGLSMRVDRQSSYVGISSINAALKVIFKAAPSAKACIQSDATETAVSSRSGSPPLYTKDPFALPPLEEGQELITVFFDRVHPFFPMIDEDYLRTNYLSGIRKDAPWFSILNMVFALGTLASGTSESDSHLEYFKRARHHINPKLETLGRPSLETVQALAMMGGYYLHYLNRPNEADVLMGAVMRVACAIGVHREYVDTAASSSIKGEGVANGSGESTATVAETTKQRALTANIRRRTWWSIFCLDTWASTTTGRPSLGRISTGVTVAEPGNVSGSFNSQDPERLKILPLIHNTSFCKIATIIQDKLSASPLIPFDDIVQLDSDLVRWWDELPSMLTKDPENSIPAFLHVPRLVMKWRYQNLRIVLHRPYLLSAALRKIPYTDLSGEEKLAVGKCRIVAAKTLEDIASECKDDLISGWNGVWLAYQACFVPLVSLFANNAPIEDIEKWRSQIKTALDFFSRMQLYSIAAKKSKDVVSKLLDAAKTAAEAADAHRRQQEALMKVMAQREQQHREQHQQQHITSHPQRLESLVTQNIKGESPHSPHGSPVNARSGNLSPAGFGGMPMAMAHMSSGSNSLQTQMAPPTRIHTGSEYTMAYGSEHTSNQNQMTESTSGIGGGRLSLSVPHHVVPTGFWDDMMWDTFPDTEEREQDFSPPINVNGFEGNWSGVSPHQQTNVNGHVNGHMNEQWGYGSG